MLPSRARSRKQASGGNRSLGQGRDSNGRQSHQDSERLHRAFPCYRPGSAGFVRSRATVPAMRRSRPLSAFAIRERASGAHNQLHDLVDIFLYTLKFPARQIELSLGSRNLSVKSDGSYLFDVDVDQVPARYSQFDPSHRSVRDARTTDGALSARASCGVANQPFPRP